MPINLTLLMTIIMMVFGTCITSNNDLDIPSLKRHFDQVQEETDRLEKEYNKLVMEREATKKARLLKKIKEGEQKNSEWKAKIERLKKVDSDEDIS
jgi:cell division protein FtsL